MSDTQRIIMERIDDLVAAARDHGVKVHYIRMAPATALDLAYEVVGLVRPEPQPGIVVPVPAVPQYLYTMHGRLIVVVDPSMPPDTLMATER